MTTGNEPYRPIDNIAEIYWQEASEIWFKDTQGDLWTHDFASGETTAIVAKGKPGEPIPPEVWIAFGTLLGMKIKRQYGDRKPIPERVQVSLWEGE